jgi:hypothetical protein
MFVDSYLPRKLLSIVHCTKAMPAQDGRSSMCQGKFDMDNLAAVIGCLICSLSFLLRSFTMIGNCCRLSHRLLAPFCDVLVSQST